TRCCIAGVVAVVIGLAFNMNDHFIHSTGTTQFNMKVWGQGIALQDLLFDLGRENIYPTQNNHIVAAPRYLLHEAHGTGSTRYESYEVMSAYSHTGQSFYGHV